MSLTNKHFKFKTTYFYLLSILLILAQILRWELIDLLTPFLWMPIEFLIYMAFAISFLALFVMMLLNLRFGDRSLLKPISFMIGSMLMVYYVNFTRLWLDYNFKFKLDDRLEVIKLVRSGELKSNVEHDSRQISLPNNFKHVSIGGGDIIALQDHMLEPKLHKILAAEKNILFKILSPKRISSSLKCELNRVN